MKEDPESPRWWRSSLKIIALATAALTAVTGLVAAINQTGWFASTKEADASSAPALATAPTKRLIAPRPLSPPDRSEFNHYPRNVTLSWDPVANASSYKVEIEFAGDEKEDGTLVWMPMGITSVNTPNHTFDFIGAQPGRWRIWALDADGKESRKSDWWYFYFHR